VHLRATESHLPYGITQRYLSSDAGERAFSDPSQAGGTRFTRPGGWKVELTCVVDYVQRYFTYSESPIHVIIGPVYRATPVIKANALATIHQGRGNYF